jgi:hypothetical protein
MDPPAALALTSRGGPAMSRIARTLPTGEPDDSSRPAIPRYPKRLTLDLSQDDHDALMGARYADRVPMADRIRALVSLWREDPQLAEAVSLRAQELMPPPPGLTVLPRHEHPSEAPPGS